MKLKNYPVEKIMKINQTKQKNNIKLIIGESPLLNSFFKWNNP